MVYQITVLDKDEAASCHILFDGDTPRAVSGTTPYATMVTTVNAGALLDLMDHRISWDHLVHSGAYRTHQTLFRLTPEGVEVPQKEAIADPLWTIAPIGRNLQAKIDREIVALQKADVMTDRH